MDYEGCIFIENCIRIGSTVMKDLSPEKIRKLKRVKLVATDLDGTLLNNQNQISTTTLDSVRRLKDAGVMIAIMTARTHSSAERIADQLGSTAPVISLDGGLVRLPHSKDNIFASYLKPSIVKSVISEAEKLLAGITLFVDSKIVHREFDSIIPSYIDRLDLDTEVVGDLNPFVSRTIQAIIGADSRQTLKAVAAKAKKFFSRVDSKVYHSSSSNDRWYLEIRNKNYSKATGLAHLERYFHIGKADVAVLGDFRNDIEAFERAGIGAAMKNAVWELKERADLVTESTNDEDGSAEFFDLIVSLKGNQGN